MAQAPALSPPPSAPKCGHAKCARPTRWPRSPVFEAVRSHLAQWQRSAIRPAPHAARRCAKELSPFATRHYAGERAALVAEQLRSYQRAWDSGAVEFSQRPMRARRKARNRGGDGALRRRSGRWREAGGLFVFLLRFKRQLLGFGEVSVGKRCAGGETRLLGFPP